MPLYESVYIARPDISTTQVEALNETLSKLVEENGGKITKNEYWGLKSLAYRIKKNRKGHYSLLNIDAPAAALSEMERNMRLNEDVLRYMSIRVEELEEGPSVMMQNKSSRDGRDDRDGRGGRDGREGRDGRDGREGRGRDDDGPDRRPASARSESGQGAPAKEAPAKEESEQ